MKYVVTAAEMKQYDSYTIEELGIPAMVLMERAALKVTEAVREMVCSQMQAQKSCRVLIAAGCGNNGGDGLAAARLLCDLGYETDVVLIGNREHMSRETAMQLRILENYGMSVGSKISDKEYDIIIDALFGVGLNRSIEGDYLQAVCQINQLNARKIAVDIPSGIDADTGRVHGAAVKADVTVTFAFVKRGLVLYPGAVYAGRVICADMGITEKSFAGKKPSVYTLDTPVSELLPKRDPSGNKGTFGKVLILAGSRQMAGAAVLCVRSSYRTGAGMVKAVTCETNRKIIQETLPEALLLTYEEEQPFSDTFSAELRRSAEWADCIVAGPGIGTSQKAEDLLKRLIEENEKPLVLDADALNLLARSESLRQSLKQSICHGDRAVILTPHAGELSRLLGISVEEIKAEPVDAARKAAGMFQAVLVSKDARTVVCQEGKPLFLNTAGNSGMATAGSGDVLTGIIGALCAGGMTAYDSAVLGTYLHACAGDRAAESKGKAGLMASDFIEEVLKLQKGRG